MSATRRFQITPEDRLSRETPMDLDPWEQVGEPRLAVRDAVWAVLALAVILAGVLLLG